MLPPRIAPFPFPSRREGEAQEGPHQGSISDSFEEGGEGIGI